MSDTTKSGLAILGAALVLGVFGDLLLRAMPWGINVLICIAALVIAVVVLVRTRHIETTGGGRWLVIPVLLFAAAFAWRDSLTLNLLNLMALVIALALAGMRTRTGQIRVAGLVDYALLAIASGLYTSVGILLLLFGAIRWKEIPHAGWSRQTMAVVRGLLIALPLVLIFGALFVAADAVFQGFVAKFFGWDLSEVFLHLFLIAFWAWIAGGFLHGMLLEEFGGFVGGVQRVLFPGKESEGANSTGTRTFVSLGITEIGIVLGALNVLFLAFVVVQFRYFFGGASLVEANVGLTYAEYARRGFFELVTVAALVLPVLLAAHWLLRKDNAVHERLFRGLAAALVVMLFVIMISAVQRMRLYQDAFGLTELRLYTTVFMGWLAIVFVWFLATVLRGRREHFAFGAMVSGFVMIALLLTLNPDDFIVRVNAGRVNAAEPFDARYVTTLSADAVPALVATLPTMSAQDRCQTAARILARWSPPVDPDWRTWNAARAQAWQIVSANKTTLQQMACPTR